MEQFTLISCVATCVIICAIYTVVTKLVRQQNFYKQASKFRGPRGLPFIGIAHLFTGSSEEILNNIVQIVNSYPTPIRFWMGPYLGFAVATPEQCKMICLSSKTIDKGSLFDFVRPWLGTGLLTASAAKWRVHRKLIAPTFHADILQSFIEIFAAQSVNMAKEMEQNSDGPEFEIHHYLSIYSLKSVCETTMGVELRVDTNSGHNYVKAVEKVAASTVRRVFSPWLYPDFIFSRTPLGKAQQKDINFLHAFTDNEQKLATNRCAYPSLAKNKFLDVPDLFCAVARLVIKYILCKVKKAATIGLPASRNILFTETFPPDIKVFNVSCTVIIKYVIKIKKAKFLERCSQPSLADSENDEENWKPRRKIFLDHFIDLASDKKALSDEALREEVDTLMATGSDTTAVVNSYMMLMLASYPEIQEKVYQEICEIYGNSENEELRITEENLKRMEYLERVIKETMRLFPIVPYIIRTATDDVNIGERTFPKGSQILLAIINLHRNEKYWPDPFKFDPDRFLPERVAERDPYTYLAFSGGLRNCIGSKYAMLSMKTLMATVLHKYVLKKDHIIPVKDMRLKMEFVLRPVDPITLRIEKRTRKDASV